MQDLGIYLYTCTRKTLYSFSTFNSEFIMLPLITVIALSVASLHIHYTSKTQLIFFL